MRLYPCPRILLIVILSEVVSLKAFAVQDYCAHYRLHCDATPLKKDPANQVEAMELISTPNFTGAMQDAVTQYWNNPNMPADTFVDKVIAAMRDAS